MVAIPPPPSASVPPHRPSFKAPRSHTMLPSLSGGAIDLAVGGAATGGSIKRQGGANACFETALPADHHWRKRTHDASSSSSSRTWATTTSPAFSKSRSFRGAIAPAYSTVQCVRPQQGLSAGQSICDPLVRSQTCETRRGERGAAVARGGRLVHRQPRAPSLRLVPTVWVWGRRVTAARPIVSRRMSLGRARRRLETIV
jgi:hypothetical protein